MLSGECTRLPATRSRFVTDISIELERASRTHDDQTTEIVSSQNKTASTQKELDRLEGRVVNVVLSDMSEPWPQTTSTWIKSVSNPYRRMMNTSGMPFRDHAGSMVCSTISQIDI